MKDIKNLSKEMGEGEETFQYFFYYTYIFYGIILIAFSFKR